MECPTCGVELVYYDYYGKTVYAENYYTYPQSKIERTGDIYHCPNREGFEEKEEAIAYAIENNIEYTDEEWEEIICESACHKGCFYTDRNDNLNEGYPC